MKFQKGVPTYVRTFVYIRKLSQCHIYQAALRGMVSIVRINKELHLRLWFMMVKLGHNGPEETT